MSFPIKVVREGEGKPIWLASSLYETKLSLESASDTAVFKMTSRANKLLAPPHVHEFDEILLVTKGTVVSFTGEERTEHELHPGDMIFLPKGTIEGFRTLGEDAEMYWFMMGEGPGELEYGSSESFFERVGQDPQGQHVMPPLDYVGEDNNVLDEQADETGFARVPGWLEGETHDYPMHE